MDQQVCKQTPPSHLDCYYSNFYVAEQPRTTQQGRLRPPLSKKNVSCALGREKTASREVGTFFFFFFFFIYLFIFIFLDFFLGGGVKTFFFLNIKKSSRWPFLAHLTDGHETTFYLRVA